MSEQGKRLATISELAIYLKAKQSKVRSMIFRREIPGVIRLGRLIRFDLDQIDRWITEEASRNQMRG